MLGSIDSIKILGIDASLRGTGWAVSENGRIIDSGVITTQGLGEKGFASLYWDAIEASKIINKVDLLMEEHTNIDVIVIELPHISQRASVAIQIGIVWGVLSPILRYQHCFPVDLKALKNWSNSKPNDKKKLVKKKVSSRMIIETDDDNIIDAIGLCFMTYDLYNEN